MAKSAMKSAMKAVVKPAPKAVMKTVAKPKKRPHTRRPASKGEAHFKKHVKISACASSGKMLGAGAKAKLGKARAKELPGPPYSGKNAGKGETAPLACKAKGERIDFRGLCGIDVVNRVRIGVELGYLPRMEGKKCPHECGTKLSLQASAGGRSPGIAASVGNVEAPAG